MLGGRGNEVSIIPVVYLRGMVYVSSLGYFSYVGSSYKNYLTYLPLSLGGSHIEEYFNKKSGKKQKFIMPQQEKARREDRRKQTRVAVRAKLLVGFGLLIPMEP